MDHAPTAATTRAIAVRIAALAPRIAAVVKRSPAAPTVRQTTGTLARMWIMARAPIRAQVATSLLAVPVSAEVPVDTGTARPVHHRQATPIAPTITAQIRAITGMDQVALNAILRMDSTSTDSRANAHQDSNTTAFVMRAIWPTVLRKAKDTATAALATPTRPRTAAAVIRTIIPTAIPASVPAVLALPGITQPTPAIRCARVNKPGRRTPTEMARAAIRDTATDKRERSTVVTGTLAVICPPTVASSAVRVAKTTVRSAEDATGRSPRLRRA